MTPNSAGRATRAGGVGAKAKRGPTPEQAAQQSVVAWLHKVLPDAIVQHVKNEAVPRSVTPQQRMAFHARRKRDGLTWGFPDLAVLLPGGRTVYIEMKRPDDGVLRARQDELHDSMRALGHMVGVATCQDTARYLLDQWGIPTREAAGAPMRAAKVRVERRDPMNDPIPF